MIFLLMSLVATSYDLTLVDEVDLVEINHYYDSRGRLVFDQVIFYDWAERDGRHHVVAWRLLKKTSQWPRRNWRNRNYECEWMDGPDHRRVIANHSTETWTQHDPELYERDFLPRERRRGLSKRKGD